MKGSLGRGSCQVSDVLEEQQGWRCCWVGMRTKPRGEASRAAVDQARVGTKDSVRDNGKQLEGARRWQHDSLCIFRKIPLIAGQGVEHC